MTKSIAAILLLLLCAFALAAQAQSTDLEQGLSVYLPMTKDLLDHSAHKLPVTVSGKVVIENGAARFEGKEDWLELPHIPLNKGPFAITMWIKVTGQYPVYGIAEQRASKIPNQHFHLMLRDNLQPYFGFYVNDAMSPFTLPSNGEWAHLVFQYTGKHQQIWINGRLICERAATAYAGETGITCIGKNPRWDNVPAKDFQGLLRDFRIYARGLSVAEIGLLQEPQNDTITASPITTKTLAGTQRTAAISSATANVAAARPFLSIEGNKLTVSGDSGQVYILQATTNLFEGWQPVAVLTNVNGRVEFTDTDSARFGQRFFRVQIR
jgi:hypothetical protein